MPKPEICGCSQSEALKTEAEVYRKAWAKVAKLSKARKPGQDRVSMSSWLTSVIARAAK